MSQEHTIRQPTGGIGGIPQLILTFTAGGFEYCGGFTARPALKINAVNIASLLSPTR